MLNINDIENSGFYYPGMADEVALYLNEHIILTGDIYPKDDFVINEMTCHVGQKFFYEGHRDYVKIQRANKRDGTFGVGEIAKVHKDIIKKYFTIPNGYLKES